MLGLKKRGLEPVEFRFTAQRGWTISSRSVLRLKRVCGGAFDTMNSERLYPEGLDFAVPASEERWCAGPSGLPESAAGFPASCLWPLAYREFGDRFLRF